MVNKENSVNAPKFTHGVIISSDGRLKLNKELCKLFADYGWEIEMSILPNIIAAYIEVIFLLATEKVENEFCEVIEVYKSYYDDIESCKTMYIAKGIDDESPMSMIEKINDIANELGFKWLLSTDETIDFLKDITLVLFEFGKKVNTYLDEYTIVLLENKKVKLLEKYHIKYECSSGSDPKCFVAKVKVK
jgi:hypothetical protein